MKFIFRPRKVMYTENLDFSVAMDVEQNRIDESVRRIREMDPNMHIATAHQKDVAEFIMRNKLKDTLPLMVKRLRNLEKDIAEVKEMLSDPETCVDRHYELFSGGYGTVAKEWVTVEGVKYRVTTTNAATLD